MQLTKKNNGQFSKDNLRPSEKSNKATDCNLKKLIILVLVWTLDSLNGYIIDFFW